MALCFNHYTYQSLFSTSWSLGRCPWKYLFLDGFIKASVFLCTRIIRRKKFDFPVCEKHTGFHVLPTLSSALWCWSWKASCMKPGISEWHLVHRRYHHQVVVFARLRVGHQFHTQTFRVQRSFHGLASLVTKLRTLLIISLESNILTFSFFSPPQSQFTSP